MAILPSRDVYYNSRAVVAGWGDELNGQAPEILKKLDVYLMDYLTYYSYWNINAVERSDNMYGHCPFNLGFGSTHVRFYRKIILYMKK